VKVVGLDTTTSSLCLGLIHGEKTLNRIIIKDKGFNSEEFLEYYERILNENNLTTKDIDGYAISIGPGSFTGIRVGLAFLKGIGFVTGKPVVPVETLYSIAYEFNDSKEYVCPVLKTKKEKVFCALYRFSSVAAGSCLRESPRYKRIKNDREETVIEQSCIKIEGLLNLLPEKDILFVGNGALEYKDEIITRCGKRARFEKGMLTYPDPVVVALIGLSKIREDKVPPLDKLEPIYL
jgi:tRNA threonylcarbamoyladenosine biosynthesis protein TsaB